MNINRLLLLDYLFDSPSMFCQIASRDAAPNFNKPVIGLAPKEIKTEIVSLYKDGYIEFTDIGNTRCLNDVNFKIRLSNSYVSLTKKGGDVWEQNFQPDWSKYFSFEMTFLSFNKAEIKLESMNRTLLLETLGSIKFISRSNVVELSPWEATYWKVIEVGYSVSYFSSITEIEDTAGLLCDEDWRKKWIYLDGRLTLS